MESSLPFDNNENKLFEFHFTSAPAPAYHQLNQSVDATPSIFQQPTQPYYAYYSDSTPTTLQKQKDMFSSPQLKPKGSPFQRKRFKTLSSDKEDSSSQDSDTPRKVKMEAENNKDDDSDEDGDTNSDSDSREGSMDPNNKRGKYKIYSEEEKAKILNFMMKHGMQKTIEIFSGNTHKITKRKLKSWIESQYKVKGVKGRKTNDPNRDQTLYEWYLSFQNENGRPPTRKEATKKALELSEDPTFQASKGWLDKFSRKYMVDFTPLKIIPPKHRKKVDGFLLDSGESSGSALSGSDSPAEGISPLLQAMHSIQPQQNQRESNMKPWMLDKPAHQSGFQHRFQDEHDPEGAMVNSFLNFSNHPNTMNAFEPMNHEKKEMMPSFEQNYYHHNQNQNQNQYQHQQQQQHQHQHQHQHQQQQAHHHHHQQQQQIPADPYFNYAFPTNYQPQYQMHLQMKPQNNFQLDLLPNNLTHSDVGNFFTSEMNYDGDGYMNGHMKMENPY